MGGLDISAAVACYHTCMLWIIIGVVLVVEQHNSNIAPPKDVLEEMIQDVIDTYDINILRVKRCSNSQSPSGKKKRKLIKYDRERALMCVNSDWMSPTPRFNDKQFERTYRIEKSKVDYIIGNLAHDDTFWMQTIDAVGRPSISPIVKLLAAQQIICYGVSFSAFQAYYQMGESTARLCVSKLTRGIVECPAITDIYLRSPSKIDAKRIVKLHKDIHGLHGMLGSLDVTKVHWANCPVALKGQFEGKEGYPTIGLEAVADYNLWIWHSSFGFPGSLNDINIWDSSPLLASMQDGTHAAIDFDYVVNGEIFNMLYYLVDGIYPTLARFVATISDPKSKVDINFSQAVAADAPTQLPFACLNELKALLNELHRRSASASVETHGTLPDIAPS